jgi:dTDP-4-amino-4,6-dideoxygalactose transaminase
MDSSVDSRVVPFNRPALAGHELAYISQAVGTMHLSGDGDFTTRCHALLRAQLAGADVLLTTSCTHALEMAALLLDITPGDEVIVPAFTFVSTANAFVLRGAVPRFADVRPDTLNLDEARLEALITPRTRAIVVVHYAGVACAMDDILAIANRAGVPVIEDNAHGLFGRYRGRPLGTFGRLSTLSFHETKNVTCGEGGALVINDADLLARAEVIREKGTNRSRFFRNEVDKYSWIDVGSSFLPSEVLAAFLCAQLEMSDAIQARRCQVWQRYHEALTPWAADRSVRLPVVPAECQHPGHLYYLLLQSPEVQESLIAHLRLRHINAIFHYLPLNQSEMGRRLGAGRDLCPVTEDASARLLRLPLSAGLTDDEQTRVIEALLAFP